jgi:hypothetical protein
VVLPSSVHACVRSFVARGRTEHCTGGACLMMSLCRSIQKQLFRAVPALRFLLSFTKSQDEGFVHNHKETMVAKTLCTILQQRHVAGETGCLNKTSKLTCYYCLLTTHSSELKTVMWLTATGFPVSSEMEQ